MLSPHFHRAPTSGSHLHSPAARLPPPLARGVRCPPAISLFERSPDVSSPSPSRRQRDRGRCGRRGDPGGRLGRPRHHHERLDLRRPARLPAGQGLHQAVSGPREVQARPGRLGHRRRRRRRRPRDDRQLLARPEGHRPGRPRLQQDRQGRDLHRHQPGQHARRTSRRTQIQAIFSGQVRNWRTCRARRPPARSTSSSARRPPARRTRSRRSSWARRSVTGAAQKASNGLVQQAVQSDKNAIGYVSLTSSRAPTPSAYKGVGCNLRNAKSGQYGGVRNFWMVTRGRARGRRSRSSSTGSQTPRRARRSSRTHWVPLK